jgi:hypothetical protein
LVTFRVATAAAVVSPLLVCKAPAGIVLTRWPVVHVLVVVTLTVMLQEPLAGIEPLCKVTDEPPIEADVVPPQVLLAEPLTIIPVGNESVKDDESFAAVEFGLDRVIVRVEVPACLMLAGLNDLVSFGAIGAGGTIVKVAEADPVLAPLLV